ncbi:RNA polymerase subunit sigma-70 [Sorangium sp. So ce1504]|uniref:RNA polymerase subunit sigma-70 n=1 Tax=Sorangium sp. So ce1504 TaxID=3133337 RepID=UPI003F61A9FE
MGLVGEEGEGHGGRAPWCKGQPVLAGFCSWDAPRAALPTRPSIFFQRARLWPTAPRSAPARRHPPVGRGRARPACVSLRASRRGRRVGSGRRTLRSTSSGGIKEASSRQTIRLAFVAALQRLPPRQRAALLLKEVLSWEAAEIAELLGMTVASVNSALQRARATMGHEDRADLHEPMDEAQRSLLGRYVAAFERQDVDALVSLLREDATWSMPPYRLWLRGRPSVHAWLLKVGEGCRGSRLLPVAANGSCALGQYRPSGPGGAFVPWAIQVIDVSAGEIVGVCSFLDAERLFPLFGLPLRLET